MGLGRSAKVTTATVSREAVREYLSAAKLSQERLAQLSGVAPATLSRWLRGRAATLSPEAAALVLAVMRTRPPARKAPPTRPGAGGKVEPGADPVRVEARLHELEMLRLVADIAKDDQVEASVRHQCAKTVLGYARGRPAQHASDDEDEPPADVNELRAKLARILSRQEPKPKKPEDSSGDPGPASAA